MSDQAGINTLKQLLFEEEFEKHKRLHQKVKEVESRLEGSLKDRTFSDGEVSDLLSQMMEVMPEKIGPTITKTLKVQISESRDDVVQALFPIIGQMIKKYVQQEIQVLSEKIDKQFEALFSLDQLALRFRAILTGTSYSELVLKSVIEPEIKEIFLIEHDSGLLQASYSREEAFDKDMIAGMLTAIKSFVEDAFEAKNQGLETISFDLYTIYIQSFNKYYVAVVLSGVMDQGYKSRLNDKILKLVKDISSTPVSDSSTNKYLEDKIGQYFDKK